MVNKKVSNMGQKSEFDTSGTPKGLVGAETTRNTGFHAAGTQVLRDYQMGKDNSKNENV